MQTLLHDTAVAQSRIRGPLRFEVSTSGAQLYAGEAFSIFIKITNPYDVAVTIAGVQTQLPAAFENLTDLQKQRVRNSLEADLREAIVTRLKTKAPSLKTHDIEKKTARDAVVRDLLRTVPFVGSWVAASYSLAQFASATAVGTAGTVASNLAGKTSVMELDGIVDRIASSDDPEATAREEIISQTRKQIEELDEAAQVPILLQSGNSATSVFTLRTQKTVFFIPATYGLHIQIQYEIDGKQNQDSIPHRLDIRAPIRALAFGSIFGSVVGFILRSVFKENSLTTIVSITNADQLIRVASTLVGTALVGLVVVLALARKRDSQPLISVEDFWGGFFLGVVAGYSGPGLLEQLLSMSPGKT